MTAMLVAHVLVSLVGILAGFVVAYGFVAGQRLPAWNAVFLTSTIATSLSGFLLPADSVLPSHVLAVLSLVALAAAVVTRYVRPWHRGYMAAALVSQYFNVFVLVVQLFQKVPALHDLAPTQTEPIFVVAHLLVLAGFVWLGVAAFRVSATAKFVTFVHSPSPRKAPG